nr:MAG TPA: multiple antibiotic resistance protein MarR/DNA family protein, HTH motif.67A [Caudoviricetes sp.]
MLKPKQRAIVEFLVREKSISTRQVRSLLGCDIKEAYDRLKRLALAGIVKNVGKPHHPEYRLTHRWRSRVAPVACPPAPQTVAQICREKWQGYQIHRIFGSAQK